MPGPSGDVSLGDQAYRELWRRIVHLEYQPLEVLQEKQISAELGVGLSPVRHALRRLEHDGLVMILPRRGTLTTEVGLSSIQWELEIRVELEGLAARLAAMRGTAAEQEGLIENVDRMEQAVANADGVAGLMNFSELDSEFHHRIYRLTRNPRLIADLERHYAHALRIWFYCHRTTPPLKGEASLEQYAVQINRGIAEAIRDRDPVRAEEKLRMHVTQDTEHAIMLLRGQYA